MPIAAVPSYLGDDFKNASPGMRFGLYLPIWTNRKDQQSEIRQRAERKSKEAKELREYMDRHGMDATIAEWTERDRNPLPKLWAKNDHAGRQAWCEVARLGKHDLELMRSLFDRQEVLGAADKALGSHVSFDAQAIGPFTTGLGNEHPLENGFSFLNPYGFPYLPGSGVKGVLRQAARELGSGDWGDTLGWSEEKSYQLQVGNDSVSLSMLDVLFGLESGEGDTEHLRGVLSFWDVIPRIDGDSLMVEIMTPHQGHYYQWKKDRSGNEIEVPPHESGSPTPIAFLTIPPEARFTFHVTCDVVRLKRIAHDLAESNRWQELLRPVFEHAFQWCGFGAKTAVGYGAMRLAEPSGFEPEGGREQLQEDARQTLSPEEQAIGDLRTIFDREKAAGRKEPQGELASRRVELLREAKSWESAELRRKAADLIEETVRWMDWPKKKREERNREIEELRSESKAGD